ncbi:BfmA/BtgA family mobilization protein [Limibacter armeniacum]|uniref:BfmA/BtgA family mobilization protein n=1 Tax=Limibacter armeniacum TaxID=466084 RepID=UPI002FE54533
MSKEYTTVRLRLATKQQLEKVAKGRSMEETIKMICEYFNSTGIDPSAPQDSDLQAVAKKLSKENGRVISFIREQENKRWIPALDNLNLLVSELSQYRNIPGQLAGVQNNMAKLNNLLNNVGRVLQQNQKSYRENTHMLVTEQERQMIRKEAATKLAERVNRLEITIGSDEELKVHFGGIDKDKVLKELSHFKRILHEYGS